MGKKASKGQLAATHDSFGAAKNSGELTVRSCGLDEIPSVCFTPSMANLWKLEATKNNITVIPPEISSCKALKVLILSKNKLTELPREIGFMKKLIVLDVSYNELTCLPSNIGRCPQLNTLNCNGNQITELPDSIGELQNVSRLDLRNNKLTGLPVNFTKLTKKLEALQLEYNPMWDRLLQSKELVKINAKNLGTHDVDVEKILAFICSGGLDTPEKPLAQVMFEKYDEDESGTIDRAELKKLCYDFGYGLSDAELNVGFMAVDADGGGDIDYPEFQKWWEGHSAMSQLKLDEASLKRRMEAAMVFKRCDADNSGALDRNEFVDLYEDLIEKRLTDLDIDSCLNDLDEDGDGLIQFNEYINWLRRKGKID